jgi:hypothetical protein
VKKLFFMGFLIWMVDGCGKPRMPEQAGKRPPTLWQLGSKKQQARPTGFEKIRRA